MKKVIVVLVIALMSFSLVQASESTSSAALNAKVQLQNEINSIVKYFPFADLVGDKKDCCVLVSFKTNDENELVVWKVKGEDKELANSVRLFLSRKVIKVDPAIGAKAFSMKVSFKNSHN